jgi:hypothetical protein
MRTQQRIAEQFNVSIANIRKLEVIEIDTVPLASQDVRTVVREAMQSGEAELYQAGTQYVYFDPPFAGDELIDATKLQYNSELGLYKA